MARKKWKPLKRIKNSKLGKKLLNTGSRAIKSRTGIDLGTVKLKKKKTTKSKNAVAQLNTLLDNIRGLASTPQQAKDNATQIAQLDAKIKAMNMSFFEKIKAWFIVKWYTAKGIVIGLVVGVLLVLGLSFGIIPMPKKRGW